MRTTSRPYLPSVPQGITDPAVQRYLTDLQRAMQQILVDIYSDLSQGAGTLTTFSAAPIATDIDANQLALRTDAGNEKIYTKIGSTIFSTALT